jgi:hypothetical protein
MKTTQDLINDTIGQQREKASIARANLEGMDISVARAERNHADRLAELEALEKKGAAAEDFQVRRLVKLITAGKEPTHMRGERDEALVSELQLAKQQVSVAARALAALVELRIPLAAEAEAADKAFNNLVRAEHLAVQQRLLRKLNAIEADYNDVCLMIHSLAGIPSGVPGQPAFNVSLDVGLQLAIRIVGGAAGQPPHVQGFPIFGPHRVTWERYFENYRAGKPVEMPKTKSELEAERFDRTIKEAVDNSSRIDELVKSAVEAAISQTPAVH